MVNDILLDDSGDLAVSLDGDLKLGFSDYTHFEDIILSAPGNWKQNPFMGMDGRKYINAPVSAASSQEFKRKLKLQADSDGARLDKIYTGKEWIIKVDGEYFE